MDIVSSLNEGLVSLLIEDLLAHIKPLFTVNHIAITP